MKPDSTRVLSSVVAILTLSSVGAAWADSIYLKSGRVIRTNDARVDGEQVIFFLHGSHQAIPLSLVDHIEDDDWRGPGLPPRSSEAVSQDEGDVAAADAAGPHASATLSGTTPSARLDAFAGFLGEGPEATQALGLLQALSGLQDADDSAGLAAITPMLGALGGLSSDGTSSVLGDLGSLGSELEKMQTILPALTRLGAALFAPEYSAAATDDAARELLQGLSKIGVSDAEIRAKARQLGVPQDVLERIGRR